MEYAPYRNRDRSDELRMCRHKRHQLTNQQPTDKEQESQADRRDMEHQKRDITHPELEQQEHSVKYEQTVVMRY
jgi:hypothetical protein